VEISKERSNEGGIITKGLAQESAKKYIEGHVNKLSTMKIVWIAIAAVEIMIPSGAMGPQRINPIYTTLKEI